MKFKNLTPHQVTILDEDNNSYTFEAEENPARIEIARIEHDTIANFTVVSEEGVEITGLPDPKKDTIYIVSARVMLAARRDDVVSPGELIRNEAGIPTACYGFTTYPR